VVTGLFHHCRPGFEGECAAEIQGRAADLGVHGQCKVEKGSGYIVFTTEHASDAALLHNAVPFADLIFARQWFVITGLCRELPAGDRVRPLVAALRAMPGPAGAVSLETPDTNDGKSLSTLARKLCRPLEAELCAAGLLRPDIAAPIRAHVCLITGTAAYVGYAAVHNSAHWPMGVARLKFPRGAPSRSTLKLEEALLTFLTPRQRDELLRPGMDAIDLGAAPGGWTWQLVHRHMCVVAVDNGAMDRELMESGLVTHVRGDGFHYRPKHPVAWMVCDIVEQPIRIADLAVRWIVQGWCRHTLFNLKLPMKKRRMEVERCLEHIRRHLETAGIPYILDCKQLYHDREEVTVYLSRR
jgi:23S rRNA (cytidine2498-2'-O)-methyltransferase